MKMMGSRATRLSRVVSVAVLTATTLLVANTGGSTASADGPSWVVTLGDSAISGEAGRWAGNTNKSSSKTDTGANAYNDNANGTAEQTPGCHRSKSAEAHIGAVNSLNLACSGARTYTQTGGDFKPGLDWYDGPAGKSQVVQLAEFAQSNDVDAVVVMIGANNFGFADIAQRCVTNWLTSPSWWKNYCSDDSDMRSRFTSSAVNARTDEIADALDNVAAAMAAADDEDYTVIIQTYWSPIPRGSQFRYSQNGWTRQSVGGCGVWNRDADWANDTVVAKMNQALVDGAAHSSLDPGDYVVLDLREALYGHRICEQGVGLLEEKGVANWTSAGAAQASEWVSQIRTLTTIFGPYQFQESLHANYWGQLAMRGCLRRAYNDGNVQGGVCRNTGGVNPQGEPNMALTAS